MTDTASSPSSSRPLALRVRFVADLVVVAVGVVLLVVDKLLPHPVFTSSVAHTDKKYGSLPDSSVVDWLFIVAVGLILGFGVLAAVHRNIKRARGSWALAALGILAGGYLILSAFAVTGIIGQRAMSSVASACRDIPNLSSSSDWVTCDVRVRWPDGTTGVVPNVPVSANDSSVVLAKPGFHAWPFQGNPHKYEVSDLLALVGVGVVLIGRSALTMVLLARSELGAGGDGRLGDDADALPEAPAEGHRVN
jgi:hypothetical protein